MTANLYIFLLIPQSCLNLMEMSQVSHGGNSIKGHDILTKENKGIFPHVAGSYVRIPQLDGPIPDPYDDALSTPNVIFPRTIIRLNVLCSSFFSPFVFFSPCFVY